MAALVAPAVRLPGAPTTTDPQRSVEEEQRRPRIKLWVRDGVLYANDWLLRPMADGSLFSPGDYGVVRGVAGPDGRLARLDWVQGDTSYPAPRVGE